MLYKAFTVSVLSEIDLMYPETETNVYSFEPTYPYWFSLKDYHYGSLNTTTDTCLQRKQNYKINIPFIQQNFVKSNVALSLFVAIIILVPIWVLLLSLLYPVFSFVVFVVIGVVAEGQFLLLSRGCTLLVPLPSPLPDHHLRKMLFSLKVLLINIINIYY